MPQSDPGNKLPLAGWLRENVPNKPTSRVIEIGPGSGDIGCVVREVLPLARSEAIEAFEPYVDQYALRDIYDAVTVADVCTVADDYFRGADVVLWIDGPEHLDELQSEAQLDRLGCLTRQGVVANTPRFEYPQGAVGGNPYETHRTTWTLERWMATGALQLWEGDVTHLWWYRGPNHDRTGNQLTVAYLVGDDECHDSIFALSLLQSAEIADEIVLLDTSSDRGPTRVMDQLLNHLDVGYTVMLHEPWCGDFAKMRNLLLDHCHRDWILMVDADEMLDDRLLSDWPDCAKSCFLAYELPTLHYVRSGLGGELGVHRAHGWYPDFHRRLLRNDRRIRYYGAIHEQPGLILDGQIQPWPRGSIGSWQYPLHHFGWARDPDFLQRKIAKRMSAEMRSGARSRQDWDPLQVLLTEAWSDCQPLDEPLPVIFDEAALRASEVVMVAVE